MSSRLQTQPQLVLFDLDGTLADTAPDLAAAANAMRQARNLPTLPYENLRPWASHGARGLIGAAFGIGPDHADFASLRDEFLSRYEQALCVQSQLFDGMHELLQAIENSGARWGIVTNKITRFAAPLVRLLELEQRAAVVVAGDTTAHAKPHPAPLLFALERCGVASEHAVYVGDDRRDIEAGRAAGLPTIAVAYGYLGEGPNVEPIERWGADYIVQRPQDLIPLLSLSS